MYFREIHAFSVLCFSPSQTFQILGWVTFTAILVILEEFEGHSGVSKMKLKIAFFLLDKFIIKNKLEICITYG